MSRTLASDLPVMLVDDEEAILKVLSRTLRSNNIEDIICISDSTKVMDALRKQEVSFVLLDLTMPNLTGREVLGLINREFPQIPVIIATADDDVNSIVDCIKKGAFDYIVKPIDTGRLLSAINGAIQVRNLRFETEILRQTPDKISLKQPEAFREIITVNQKMSSIFQYIEAISGSSQPVMILGETGVGKDLIAKAVHKTSGRKGNFVTVNVAGLDDQVFADTLFGHTKGAYTGAISSRAGLIKKAEKGTLFLDEIGDLSLTSQVKLLRLIQEREYLPLGSDEPVFTDTRIIVATHRNLEKLKDTGEFRKDLFFRLLSHQIKIPPLRERLNDLQILFDHFIEQVAKELKKKKPNVPKEIRQVLGAYHFPGNIRELQAMIFDALSKHKSGVLSLKTFREIIGNNQHQDENKDAEEPLLRFGSRLPTFKEGRVLLAKEALFRSNNNQTVAAKLLGISRQSLNQYLQSSDISNISD
ncbi:MAG: sigma-54 dependent transcriptional regulator [Deltaproteobacteria bacterium]|nr:sigma-54 dependent transcriptional regulator [Deltaproteobacteria bacterium]